MKFCYLLAILIHLGVEGASTGSEVKYLGTLKVPTKVGTQGFQESDYYVSTSTSWGSAAEERCKGLEYGGLVAIESQEEWVGIEKLLEKSSVPGDIYWTDGIHSSNDGTYHWASTGLPLPSWAPWPWAGNAAGVPQPRNDDRVAVYYFNSTYSQWIHSLDSQFLKFICERPNPLEPVPCYNTNDLLILLDSSGSIGTDNYVIAKTFAARLSVAYAEHKDNHMGFVTYSNDVSTIVDLGNSLTPAQLESDIMNAPYKDSGTQTAMGITHSTGLLVNNKRGFTQNLVVVTDGISADPDATREAAQAAIAQGIRTFSVGITDNVNPQELLDIAGGIAENVFRADEFDRLLSLLRGVSVKVCED